VWEGESQAEASAPLRCILIPAPIAAMPISIIAHVAGWGTSAPNAARGAEKRFPAPVGAVPDRRERFPDRILDDAAPPHGDCPPATMACPDLLTSESRETGDAFLQIRCKNPCKQGKQREIRLQSGSFQTTPSVPEPVTWSMMLLGAGLIGCGLRMARRTDEVTVTAV
jgi:hypothetical protein